MCMNALHAMNCVNTPHVINVLNVINGSIVGGVYGLKSVYIAFNSFLNQYILNYIIGDIY
jgi:hypothetical protein